MSDANDDSNLKAGHAPAVKVGGMRVTSHKKPEKEQEEASKAEDDQEEYEVPAKVDKHHQQLLISGVVTKGDKDFPEAAVRHTHDKPQPTHVQRNPNTQQHRVIQQPRKQ